MVRLKELGKAGIAGDFWEIHMVVRSNTDMSRGQGNKTDGNIPLDRQND